MKSPTPRRLKWLLICVVVALVGWLVWITVQDLSPIDIRSQASRATAIGYGTLHTANGSSHIIIDQISTGLACLVAVGFDPPRS